MQLTFRRLLIWLGYLALGAYVLLGVAFLGMRYWVLPQIDQWREPLQRELSDMLPVQVELGAIVARWHGRNPQISLRDTVLRDDEGRELLSIPSLQAVVAWSSLLSGRPRFLELRAEGVDLTLRRDAGDRISLVGYEMNPGGTSSSRGRGSAGLMHWLSGQDRVRFTHSRIVWHDEYRAAPPLELRDVSLELARKGDGHVFAVQATPPATLGEGFRLQAEMQLALAPDQSISLNELSGLFHVHVEAMRPLGWQPWLDVHSALGSGRVSWLGWQQVDRGALGRHVSQVVVKEGSWHPGEGMHVRADRATLHLAGDWASLHALFAGEDTAQAATGTAEAAPDVAVAMQMEGLDVEVAELFEAPLRFEQVGVSSRVRRGGAAGLQLHVQTAQLRNAHMDVAFEGSWQERGGGRAGLADLQGVFKRAELAAIVHYLPSIVNEDARQWMRHGLLAGRLIDAPLRLQGDLAHFPFGEHPERGDFLVGGKVHSAIIDYAPAEVVGAPGWPRLEALNGRAQLHRTDLTIEADTLRIRPGGQTIDLRAVGARIPDIENDSVLTVKGTSRAPAAAYLALLQHSPLKRSLEGLFDQARGDGTWQVPIALTIPLTHSVDTQVQGEVHFDKAGLQLAPHVPALSGLSGRLAFTEQALTAHELRGSVLGGPVRVSGGVGKGQKGLVFEGRLEAAALDTWLEGRLAGQLEGHTPYRLAVVRHDNGALGLQLNASLEGMGIQLPAPLRKAATDRWPLRASWAPASAKDKRGNMMLDVRLGELLEARFLHAGGERGKNAFFKAGVINVRGKAELPASGLTLDVQGAEIDVDAWRKLAGMGGGEGASGPGLPELRDVRVQADRATVLGTTLEKLTFTARRPEGNRWRVDISSTETAGTLFWQERRGRIEGEIEAHFQRLAVGRTDGEGARNGEDDDISLSDEVDFPAIRLRVDNLRLYGREVGALSVVGLNDVRAHRWRLEQLQLRSPHARLDGSGVWQLKGPQRGLRLQARASFDDLGAYLSQAGFTDLVASGQGQVEGVVEWRDVPWRFDLSRLNGDIKVDLSKGRFINVGSNSARVLELVSLQSVKRLASLNWNPSGLLKQGFPFDRLQGDIKLKDGIMHSENYRVTGPVATIVIAGDVSLPAETLDLYAVVVPNLDVSGAAIAAGIAVNPIVGVGAFLTQWLLKEPMSRAMTAEYRVRGSFDEPDIEEVETVTGGEKGTLPGHPVSESGRNQ